MRIKLLRLTGQIAISYSCLLAITTDRIFAVNQQTTIPLERQNLLAQNSPSSSEDVELTQALIAELNRIRNNPQKYADWLQDLTQYYSGLNANFPEQPEVRTREGLSALTEAIAFLRELKPLPPLELNLSTSGKSPKVSNSFTDTLSIYGTDNQLIDFPNPSSLATNIAMQLVVNDGVISRNRRRNFFNSTLEISQVSCQGQQELGDRADVCTITYLEPNSDSLADRDEENQSNTSRDSLPPSTDPTPTSKKPITIAPNNIVKRGVLEFGDAAVPSDGSLYDFYRFEARAGQSVTISVESKDFDTYLAVVNTEGKIIAENDDISQQNTNSSLNVTFPENGVYRLIINAYNDRGQGEYVLTISP